MPSKVWGEITYPFPNFNGCSKQVSVTWIGNYIPQIWLDVITCPCSICMFVVVCNYLSISWLPTCFRLCGPRGGDLQQRSRKVKTLNLDLSNVDRVLMCLPLHELWAYAFVMNINVHTPLWDIFSITRTISFSVFAVTHLILYNDKNNIVLFPDTESHCCLSVKPVYFAVIFMQHCFRCLQQHDMVAGPSSHT